MNSDWWFGHKWSSARSGDTPIEVSWDGGSACGVLYTDSSPLTTSAFRARFPLRIDMVHAAWSGEMVMSTTTCELDVDVEENSTRLVRPGDITWDAKVGEVCLVYGDAECRLPSGPNTVVVIGSLTTNPDSLAELCQSIRFTGVKSVTFDDPNPNPKGTDHE